MSNTIIPGMSAPSFIGKDQNGNTVSLDEFKGSNLILYFYPKDDTPGCTKEACNLRDNYQKLLEKGYKILGVSADDEDSHQKFISKYNLPFQLLADIDKKVSTDYNVYGEKVLFGKTSLGVTRKTFIIDENGLIKRIIGKVETDNHSDQILRLEGLL